KVWRAYEHMNNGDLAIEKGEMAKALEEYDAAQKMFPENLEMTYWTAVSLANQKQLDKALFLFKKVFKKDENWRLLTERLPHSELLNIEKKDLDKILSLK
ncbi:MAG: tetratricopeptide repeat protein, partial [Promethearchaeota archaeon]